MRTRHTGLARNLAALWFVLFFACSFTHAHAGASAAPDDSAAVPVTHASALQTSACPAQLDLDSAAAEACNALQNSPLNQHLLMLLALAALLGLAYVLLLPVPRQRLGGFPALAALTPGLPTPIRTRLHRYNE